MKNKFLKYLGNIIFIIFTINLFYANNCKEENIVFEEEPKFTNINLNNDSFSTSFSILSNSQNFRYIKDKEYNYMRIKIENIGKNSNSNNIISYYKKDNNFIERKQLSQTINNSSIMWLNKEQIKESFYFSIECEEYPCGCQMNIDTSEIAELSVDEQYTYYITEDNQNMIFKIKNNYQVESIKENTSDYLITIWIKGNKEIKTKLEGGNYEKPSNKYNYYRINLSDFIQKDYSLTVDGKIDDLINIGILLFHKEIREDGNNILISETIFDYNGIEVTGYLKPNEIVYYKFLKEVWNKGYYIDYDNNLKNFHYAGIDEYDENYIIQEFNTFSEESFYSIQFLDKTENDQQNINNYSPQLMGIFYHRYIDEGEIIGLIPMKPENDFQFLTFENFPFRGEMDFFMYTCENYPICNDKDALSKSTKINGYKSYFYSYNKDEWDKTIFPINKKQNILLIKCKKGLEIDKHNYCGVNVNIKTEKNKINNIYFKEIDREIYRYIRKDDINKYFFRQTNIPIYLNIEIISGNIEINPSLIYEFYESENKKLYIFNENRELDISIKGLTDSIYSIIDYNEMKYNYNNRVFVGLNYIFNISKRLMIEPYKYINSMQFYLGFYPINDCKVNVKSSSEYENFTLPEIKDFYQDIIPNDQSFNYYLTNINNNSCLCHISIYELDNITGISLANNVPQKFLFNNQTELTFSYPHLQKNNDVKITLELINEGIYTIKLYLNDKNYKEFGFHSKQEIKLSANDLKSNCKDFNTICKILFTIKSDNKDKESILKISINKKENENKKEDKDYLKFIYIGISCFIILIIIIVVVILVVLRTSYKNKDLKNDVNKISFEQETVEEENDNGLLDN